MVGMPDGKKDPDSDPVLSGCAPSSKGIEGKKYGLFCKVKKMATRDASKSKQAIKQLASAISSARAPSGSRNKVTPMPAVALAMPMFQALIKEPMGSLDVDSERVQFVPGAVDLIEFIALVRMQLHAVEVTHVKRSHERAKDMVTMTGTIITSIEYDGKFPTDFEAYVKRVFPKAPRTAIASMLVEMLKLVLGNMTVPFIATDTMRTLADVHRALGEFDHVHASFVVTVHELLALKLDPSQRAILDALIQDSAVPRRSNLALRAMEPMLWRRGEAKDFALFDDFVAALVRYVRHAPQELEHA
ncbi:hypothetical protein GGF32_006606 [Allomyces javanicus]|nr:hypothetical protein GGF32_006606 [Allomyces javanicus]